MIYIKAIKQKKSFYLAAKNIPLYGSNKEFIQGDIN